MNGWTRALWRCGGDFSPWHPSGDALLQSMLPSGDQSMQQIWTAIQHDGPDHPASWLTGYAFGIADLARDVMGQPRDGGGLLAPADPAACEKVNAALKAALEADPVPLAVVETDILPHPPSTFNRCFNMDGEGMSVK